MSWCDAAFEGEVLVGVNFAERIGDVGDVRRDGGAGAGGAGEHGGAGAAQMVANALLHFADQRDAFITFPVAAQRKLQRRQGRVEGMAEIGDMQAGAAEAFGVLVDEGVELADQRPKLRGLVGRDVRGAAGAHVLQPRLQRA